MGIKKTGEINGIIANLEEFLPDMKEYVENSLSKTNFDTDIVMRLQDLFEIIKYIMSEKNE